MLGEHSADEVRAIVVESFGTPAVPELADPAARERARSTAEACGLLEQIEAGLTDEQPIETLPYTRFRDYVREGNRRRYESLYRRRDGQTELAAMACLLGMDKADYLNDLLWADCESTWWIMPAHERHGTPIDLRAAMTACRMGRLLTALRDVIAPEVRRRVLDEVHRRVLRPNLSPEYRHHWKGMANNWNAVCLGSIGIASMLLETEPERLAETIVDALTHLPNFLSGFAADGGCSEGPSYWRFGFGWFIRFAAALHTFTGGRIDIATGDRVEQICRYPLAVAVEPGRELCFADAREGFQDPVTAQLINRFHDLPELLGLCLLDDAGRPVVSTLEGLLLYDGWTARPRDCHSDTHLRELGLAMVRAGGTVVGAKAGHNAEHHNHNDIGSFVVYRDGQYILTDPGGPIYSARTFSSRRYESIFCNSLGHSVPVIDGRRQAPGREHAGALTVEGLDGDGDKRLVIELGGAYDAPALRRLTRTIELAGDGSRVRLADAFAFDGEPPTVEEAFLTAHPAEADADGSRVVIRPEGGPEAVLSAEETPGAFTVVELTEESRQESSRAELLRRIAFAPSRPAATMTLAFRIAIG